MAPINSSEILIFGGRSSKIYDNAAIFDVNTERLTTVQLPIPKCFESDNPAYMVQDGEVVALVCDDKFFLKILRITKSGDESF